MSRGKSICSVLKTIRKQVADANGIEYEPRECHHQGDCRGTCPACEAEVRYIPDYNAPTDIAQSRTQLESMGFTNFDCFDYVIR